MLRTSEIVSLVCFLSLAVMAARPGRRRSVRARTAALSTLVAAGVAALAWLDTRPSPAAAWTHLRQWSPLLLLLLAYWLPGTLVVRPRVPFERWLLAADRRLCASRAGRWAASAPRLVREGLELGYLAVYPLVPLAFAVLLATGHQSHADGFWSVVLTAEYACYLPLPWLASRPPRDLERTRPWGGGTTGVRRLNLWLLGQASNRWNTFPSGHVAGAFACAFAVLPLERGAGAMFLALAVLIAAGSVAGRYHYFADAAAGMLVAALAFLLMPR